jgi:hypothetical protein
MSACSLRILGCLTVFAALALYSTPAQAEHGEHVGVFQGHQDVGTVLHPGSAEFDQAHFTYTVSGSGENMWFGEDDFHFAWRKMSGDVSLTASITFVGATGNSHRKGVLMIRKTLDANSIASDLAVHGDGLTSLQFRDTTGGNMAEVQTNVAAPKMVRIEKRGDFIYAFVSGADGILHPSGAATKLPLGSDFYIGIGVCSHDKDVVEKAIFSNVALKQLKPATGNTVLVSSLEAVPVSGDRRVQYVAEAHFEAPNWSRDGKAFIFNQDGLIRRLALGSSEPTIIPTTPQNKCNDDHGFSPDGNMLAISDTSDELKKSQIYIVPAAGGTPRLVTKDGPSYWHGWSPDGKRLAFAAVRDGKFDIFTIPVEGGDETRVTSAPGDNECPDYSPDGARIYFNSNRTGQMQIWRMKPDGSNQEQVTFSESNDWFPHVSPDGQWMVYLSYDKSVTGHPPNKDVELKLMSLKDKKITVLAKLFGGQGTANVPSWSPDSKKVAFVSYELLPEEDLASR